MLDEAKAWLAEDPDPRTREELARLIERAEGVGSPARDSTGGDSTASDSTDRSSTDRETALAELADRFGDRLRFGTAGLRGELGAGPNRMNRVVVMRAAAGLAAYLNQRGGGRVVIGYDARHSSDVFAADSAAILQGAGLDAVVLPRPLPTPILAFAIRHLGCVAGVMVTASHNPAQDNGYKVYLGDGSQIVPPADADISAAIDAVGPVAEISREQTWTVLGEDIVEAYLARVTALLGTGPRELRVAYTPVHGVGGELVQAAMERTGFTTPVVVPAQADPDPAFPTTPFPNPEEAGTMDLVLDLGTRVGADLMVANDPDADRCAVAVPTPDGPRLISGDELGALVATHLLNTGRRGALATTIVSSTLLRKIAAHRGVRYVETLTGFKWLGRVPGLMFSYEEALGYCVDPAAVADKDGIATMLLVLEYAAAQRQRGRTLLDELDDLARTHGLHHTEQFGVRMRNYAEMEAVIDRLRSDPPTMVGTRAVVRVDDLREGSADLPPTEGLRFSLTDDARILVRPSGTEPKLKAYFEVVVPVGEGPDAVAAARTVAAADVARMREALAAAVGLSQ